jgi:hypothetical protein
MSLGEKPAKPSTVMQRAKEIAKKYLDLPYLEARNKIKEETPCSRSTAHKALAAVKREREKPSGEGAEKTPEVTIAHEKEKTPEFLGEKEEAITETLEELPTPPLATKLITEGELTADEMSYLFEAANDGIAMFNEKRAPSPKSAKMLGKLWFRPFNKWWGTISEENPLLAIAIIVTLVVYLPALIGVVIDWRKQTSKDKDKSKEKTP